MRGQLQAPAALPTDKKPAGIHWRGGRVCSTAGLHAENQLPCLCRQSAITRWTSLRSTSYRHSDYTDGLKIMNYGQDGSVMSVSIGQSKTTKPLKECCPVTLHSQLTLQWSGLNAKHKTYYSCSLFMALCIEPSTKYAWTCTGLPCNSETSHVLPIIKFILKQTAILYYGKWYSSH